MASKIIVPDIGDFENVEIIEILVKSGDKIKKNDSIVTLESDKSSVEVPSTENGTVEKILLADEIIPDTCRLWDSETDKKLDKDIFRNNLGNLIDGYQEIAKRLNILHEQPNIRPVNFSKPKAVKIKKK